jgi:lipid A 3-O-deacylase
MSIARCFFLLLAPLVAAAQDPCLETPERSARGLYVFLWENDFWGGFDENYTNGNRIAYTSLPQDIESLHGRLASRIFRADCADTVLYSLALGQSMYTPERDSLTETALLEKQHPYAGWVYSEYSLHLGQASSPLVSASSNPNQMKDWQTLSLQVGAVGPIAKQEFTQDTFHNWIDDEHFLGWDNQIGNELALLLSYERRWRYSSATLQGTQLQADVLPAVGAAVGNVLMQVSGGLVARIGDGLSQADLPTRVHPGASGVGLFTPSARLRWYAFVGVEGRLVARNIFLDGNTFKDSARVEKNMAVYDRLLGASLYRKKGQFTFTLVERSEEFIFQKGPHRFGSASISVFF